MSLISTITACLLSAAASGAVTWKIATTQQQSAEALYDQRAREAVGPEGLVSLHAERRGWSAGFGGYRLASFDQGQSWWSISEDGRGISAADPALLAHLRGSDALVDYVQQHGPINAARLSGADTRVLAGAGLAVATAP